MPVYHEALRYMLEQTGDEMSELLNQTRADLEEWVTRGAPWPDEDPPKADRPKSFAKWNGSFRGAWLRY